MTFKMQLLIFVNMRKLKKKKILKTVYGNGLLPFQRLTEEENMLAPSLQQFSLRTEMLPSYIPIRVAEKILFVGESVQMFENHNHSPSRAGEGTLSHDWNSQALY